jgi:hypothetical protein
MSFTQTQLDAVTAAIASGTLRVTYDGKTVEYRSLAELVQAKGMIERALNTASGTGRATHFNPAFDRGV